MDDLLKDAIADAKAQCKQSKNIYERVEANVKSATATGLDSLVPNTLDQYSVVSFPSAVPFFTGDEIFYKPSGTHYVGLETGRYYCEIVSTDKKRIRLYGSRASIESATYIPLKAVAGDHKFILNSQRSEEIAAQKTLKKFPLTSSSNTYENSFSLSLRSKIIS